VVIMHLTQIRPFANLVLTMKSGIKIATIVVVVIIGLAAVAFYFWYWLEHIDL